MQGYYHISFFAKYWLLNNTQMPLQIQMKTETFSFEKYDLPYESLDFDFESIKKFLKQDPHPSGKEEKAQRKQSIDSFQTETFKDTKSHQKSIEHQKDGMEYVNYKEVF